MNDFLRNIFKVKQRSTQDIKSENFSKALNEDIEMVPVKGGSFILGITKGFENQSFSNEQPVRVSLSDYFIGKYPVTQQQWKKIMGNNPSLNCKSDDLPVENISWFDVQEFIERINKLSGKTFALPTDAQWEFAAIGGTKSCGYYYSGSNNPNDVAWHMANSNCETHPVGYLKPNELGIFDMSGNVSEWCLDWFGSYPPEGTTDPAGPSSGFERIYRGGSFNYYPKNLQLNFRNSVEPDYAHGSLGFRLVLLNEPLPDTDTSQMASEKIDVEMVDVERGAFLMGATENEGGNHENALPRHEVTLSDFSIGKYPVTKLQWQLVMEKIPVGENRFIYKGDNTPVTFVNWEDVQEFIRRLNQMTGKNYSLPTEAQWEFAARGGKLSKGFLFSGSNSFEKVGWIEGQPKPVGLKRPNELGIYDMSGNVSEWCQDGFYKYTKSPKVNPIGPKFPVNKVCRGGYKAKVFERKGIHPEEKQKDIGFRLVLNKLET